MARVKGPLMSMEASGNVAGQLQFRGNRHGTHVYRPTDPRQQNQGQATQKQTAVRARYRQINAAWNAMSAPERDDWNATAETDPRAVSGWNLYLAAAMATGNQPTTLTWDADGARWDNGAKWS